VIDNTRYAPFIGGWWTYPVTQPSVTHVRVRIGANVEVSPHKAALPCCQWPDACPDCDGVCGAAEYGEEVNN
jgi:hypothetical protein